MISGAISVGIVIYVIYSGGADVSLLIEPLILFALLTVLSIVFQILSHKRIPKRTAS